MFVFCLKLFYQWILSHFNVSTAGVSEQDEGASLLLILKWGGELTPAGRIQAEELGRAFRCMYPGGHGWFDRSLNK